MIYASFFFTDRRRKNKMTKEELDKKITGLSKAEQKKVLKLIDEAGQKAFVEAIKAGKQEEEAKLIADESAINEADIYFAKMEGNQRRKEAQKNESDKKEPEKPIEQVLGWGGYTALQTEQRFKGLKKSILEQLPNDSHIRITNFVEAPEADKKQGKNYRVTVVGNKSGTKRILV
jgi:hypothetical protein